MGLEDVDQNHSRDELNTSSQMLLLSMDYIQGKERLEKVVVEGTSLPILEGDQLNLLNSVDLDIEKISEFSGGLISPDKKDKGQTKRNKLMGGPLSKNPLESLLTNEFLITPLPECVVNTDLTKDLLSERSASIQDNLAQSRIPDASLFDSTSKSDSNMFLRNLDGLLDVHEDMVVIGEEVELPKEASESESECEGHVISDKPVVCRAMASLPGKHLKFLFDPETKNVTGVAARGQILRKTRFGPVEGCPLRAKKPPSPGSTELAYSVVSDKGKITHLSLANENLSNWMRYVRPATTIKEQNVHITQIGRHLHFVTSKTIEAKEELMVWYGKSYAERRNLPLLEGTVDDLPYSCLQCDDSFNDMGLLRAHIEAHKETDQERTLEGTECNRIMDQNEPASPESNMKRFICLHCKKIFKNATFLNIHMLTHAANDLEAKKKVECPICKLLFDSVLGLKSHIHSHLKDGFYHCSSCSKKFSKYSNVRKHIRSFHSGRKYKCTVCTKGFMTLDKLRLHELVHSDVRPFVCANCDKTFKRKDKLTSHMKRCSQWLNSQAPDARRKTLKKKKPPKEKTGESTEDYNRYIYKCHICILGFKRRGMLVNHLANRHPEISRNSVPELNLPILKATKDYYCQYCDKIYKSNSKRKAHILKNHPGEELPLSDRHSLSDLNSVEDKTFSQTVGSVTTNPQSCAWCHKQYASKAKLLQHQRKKHPDFLPKALQNPKRSTNTKQHSEMLSNRPESLSKEDGDSLLLHESLQAEISDFEITDVHSISEGEFLIDGDSLKKAIQGEFSVEYTEFSEDTVAELSQMISDSRSDQYFRIYQTENGLVFAQPIGVWDPYQIQLQSLDVSELEPSALT